MAAELLLEKMHRYSAGARTKGYIKNNNTGEKKFFFFNPTEIEFERGATYQEISSPGLSYPLFTYVRGNSISFSLPLKVIDKSSEGLIKDWEEFLDKFLPPTTNSSSYKKPDEATIVMGSFIRECLIESLNTKYEEFDSNLIPTECTFTLSLRQV